MMKRLASAAVSLAACTMLAGCSALPAAGPLGFDINGAATSTVNSTEIDRLPYAVVDITPEALRIIPARSQGSFSGRFTDRRPAPTLTVGIGDTISVSIFEASAGGLFIPAEAGSRSGNFIQLPPQEVDRQGNISIPYAGVLPAAGRTVRQVQNLIEERLRNRAIEPQAVVAITDRRSAQVTILGDVGSSRLTLNPLGERILDVIARAGGTKFAGYEMFVALQRGKERATVTFNQLLSSPEDNVYVLPGDTIYVFRQAPTFLVFGATSQQGQIFFEKENLSMSEALAKIGGLVDTRSDPDAVFLYRFEDRKTAEALGVDTTKLGHSQTVPVVYRTKLRDPANMFVASGFQMRDRDIIYVANSQSVDWLKFISFINSNVSFATNVATVPDIGRRTATTRLVTTGGSITSTP
ncbi:polysaccharide biosynthesis/export family protein [Bosea sp. 124]|uniref:polysaccharide biosynthesis/export family protein n=1 Tax=Bosea sp. 124 TaxID=2135642 RepID=UPI000D337905|nr:polysaccharide biosynthesis/export family protein [Bosea sp. 124]PTM41721.1 polysaccharide export outer membrane protein [Bosea sp. 124]